MTYHALGSTSGTRIHPSVIHSNPTLHTSSIQMLGYNFSILLPPDIDNNRTLRKTAKMTRNCSLLFLLSSWHQNFGKLQRQNQVSTQKLPVPSIRLGRVYIPSSIVLRGLTQSDRIHRCCPAHFQELGRYPLCCLGDSFLR